MLSLTIDDQDLVVIITALQGGHTGRRLIPRL